MEVAQKPLLKIVLSVTKNYLFLMIKITQK